MSILVHQIFCRVSIVLIALAFLILPASSEPVCDPHLDHSCVAAHLDDHATNERSDLGPASHEHETHSHGSCHAPMVAPDTQAASYELFAEASFWLIYDDAATGSSVLTPERPPRA